MARLGLFPFFKVTALWFMGILLYQISLIQSISIYSLWIVNLTLGLVLAYCLLPKKWQWLNVSPWCRAVITMLIVLSASILRSAYSKEETRAELPSQQSLILELTESPNLKKQSYRAKAKVINPKNGLDYGKAQLYIYDSSAAQLKYGARIQVQPASIKQITSSHNPRAFNYAEFMAAKGINYQSFLSSNDFLVLRVSNPNFTLKGKLQSLRNHLLGYFDYLPSEEGAIAKALVFGYKEELSEDVRDRFSETGAMHILAVSGLHVGIIYIFFSFIFSKIFAHSKTRVFKVSGILVFLWLYAFLAGLPPSVLRASIMFSVIALGREIIRANNVYNNVLFSACLLLVFKPELLFNVSFQLSYAAVLGIISFQPHFAKLWTPKNKIVNWLWVLITVSFAAQLSTFPITLHYFHQFPWVFPFTNLIAIPGAIAVVNGGLLLPLFSNVLWLCEYYQILFESILKALNNSIAWFSSWPYSHVEAISLHSLEVFILFFFIVSIYLAWTQKKKKYIFIALMALLLQQSYSTYFSFKQNKKQDFAVFNTGFESTYGLRNGSNSKLIFHGNSYKHSFATDGYFTRKGAGKPDTVNAIETIGLKIGKRYISIPAGKILTDLPSGCRLILSKRDYANNYSHYPKEQIVFDSSVNPDWILDKFPNFANSHFVQRDGAFILK